MHARSVQSRPPVKMATRFNPRPTRPARAIAATGRINPRQPISGKDRHRMIHATAYRLGMAIRKPCKLVLSMPHEQLATLVDRLPDGEKNRRGKARRLAEKLLRLRGQ